MPAQPPPPRSVLARRSHNLPHQASSFVGRERECAEVVRLIAGEEEGRSERSGVPTPGVVTLTGPGGCGKTRLALQVARDVVVAQATGQGPGPAAYPDGVCLTELAALSDPTLVAQTVAFALGVAETPGRPMADALVEALAGRRFLLVLDNCEHLLDACAALTHAILRACPGVRVLATSREPLRVPGELVWPVPGLALPPEADGGHFDPPERLAGYAAVRLFLERARFARPGLAPTPGQLRTIERICRRLDGLPLAIELAAVRVRSLPVEQIAERLDDRFGLLTGGSRTAPARQQTLRAAVGWSYDLLSDPERLLFERLSVFAGDWHLEAAEGVCPDPGDVRREEVLDLLARLVDKSLVVAYEAPAGRARYRLLETLRQYARDRLAAGGGAEAVARRHAAYYLGLAERLEPHLRGSDQTARLDGLEQEIENLRAALSWSRTEAAGVEGAETGLRLAAALGQFWFIRGYHGEGRGWLDGALARAPDSPAPLRAKALEASGYLAVWQGDRDLAGARLRAAVALAREAGDAPLLARSLQHLAQEVGDGGDQGQRMVLLEESLALSREMGDRHGIADALNLLGRTARSRGDHERAAVLSGEALALYRELGDTWGTLYSLGVLGRNALYLQDYSLSEALGRERLALSRALRDDWAECATLCTMGLQAWFLGDRRRATALLEESLALARATGHKHVVALALYRLSHVALIRGDLGSRGRVLPAESACLPRAGE